VAATPGFAGMSADRLAALLVGRWPSGAPVLRSPGADNPALGADAFASNDFAYVNANPPMRLLPAAENPPDTFPPAIADPLARVCPYGAHIRKINPRDESTDIGGPRVTLPRLILRRGLPFGPSLQAAAMQDDGLERGLMFACYTASIESTFEFLTRDWANSLTAPRGNPDGHDLVIGQSDDQTTGRTRRLELATQNGSTETISTDVDWVTPTGGGYFFAPSISALRQLTGQAGRGKPG
jgi:Dyp-type peroxidase family